MTEPIKGFEGSVNLDSTLTGAIKSWEVSLDITEQTAGPYIGDGGNLYPYQTTRALKGKLEADIPNGTDAGQTAFLMAGLDGSSVPIVLVTTAGYTVNIPSGLVSGFQMTQDAANTVKLNFDFKSLGTYTIEET